MLLYKSHITMSKDKTQSKAHTGMINLNQETIGGNQHKLYHKLLQVLFYNII